mmetsp:Transcript_7857/g.19395  ORF Transcript_7857/g.19395 Transcript_7857/m.19395 type:complete len:231 (-) Transcript_7857:2625-3317(-)
MANPATLTCPCMRKVRLRRLESPSLIRSCTTMASGCTQPYTIASPATPLHVPYLLSRWSSGDSCESFSVRHEVESYAASTRGARRRTSGTAAAVSRKLQRASTEALPSTVRTLEPGQGGVKTLPSKHPSSLERRWAAYAFGSVRTRFKCSITDQPWACRSMQPSGIGLPATGSLSRGKGSNSSGWSAEVSMTTGTCSLRKPVSEGESPCPAKDAVVRVCGLPSEAKPSAS